MSDQEQVTDHVAAPSQHWRSFVVVLSFIVLSSCAALTLRSAETGSVPEPEPHLAELLNDTHPPADSPTAPPLSESKPARSSKPAAQPDLIDELLQPFISAAHTAREARAQKDPDYAKRIDPALNKNRINFLLFGYGQTFEPPHPVDIIGTITILSLDYRTHRMAQISLTHDARAPEIERYMRARGQPTHPSKIDQTFRIGGFELMRLAVENATGLSMDFQVVVEDVVVKNLVDDVLGSIEVDNPIELATNPIYIHNVRYDGLTFPKGKQSFNGIKTMTFLKGISLPPYDPAKENNLRKQVIYRALSKSVQDNIRNPLFALRAVSFLHQQLERKSVQYDFDVATLLLDSLKRIATNPSGGKLTMPVAEQNIYLVDERFGDGGFTWVMGTQNPIIKDELRRGIYKDTAMVVTSGNPNAENLALGYWGSVRAVVKHKLLIGNSPIEKVWQTCDEPEVVKVRARGRARCGQ